MFCAVCADHVLFAGLLMNEVAAMRVTMPCAPAVNYEPLDECSDFGREHLGGRCRWANFFSNLALRSAARVASSADGSAGEWAAFSRAWAVASMTAVACFREHRDRGRYRIGIAVRMLNRIGIAVWMLNWK